MEIEKKKELLELIKECDDIEYLERVENTIKAKLDFLKSFVD